MVKMFTLPRIGRSEQAAAAELLYKIEGSTVLRLEENEILERAREYLKKAKTKDELNQILLGSIFYALAENESYHTTMETCYNQNICPEPFYNLIRNTKKDYFKEYDKEELDKKGAAKIEEELVKRSGAQIMKNITLLPASQYSGNKRIHDIIDNGLKKYYEKESELSFKLQSSHPI